MQFCKLNQGLLTAFKHICANFACVVDSVPEKIIKPKLSLADNSSMAGKKRGQTKKCRFNGELRYVKGLTKEFYSCLNTVYLFGFAPFPHTLGS